MADVAALHPRASVTSLIVGISEASHKLRREVVRAAACDAKVLITGETGAGKDLVASCIHALGARAGAPLLIIHCGGIADALLESELFGHVKGSFTGAIHDRTGKLAAAHSGTVMFDGIGETSPRMQGVLLRFLENGEVQRVGDLYERCRVDVRVIATTSRSLEALVTAGRFREDLYYRLNVVHIHVPPLRDRREDIPALVDHFAARLAPAPRRKPWLLPASIDALLEHDWPGNVRELENLLKRLAVNGDDDVAALLPAPSRPIPPAVASISRERRRTIADDLFEQLIGEQGTFWTLVYPRLLCRDLTRADVRALIQKGLERTCGSYKRTARLFHVADDEYKRFLSFLRVHGCGLRYHDFR